MMKNINTFKIKKFPLTLAIAGVFAVNIASGFVNPSISEAATYLTSISMDKQGFTAAPATDIVDTNIAKTGNQYLTSVSMDVQGFTATSATNIADTNSTKTGNQYLTSVSMDVQGFTPAPATDIADEK